MKKFGCIARLDNNQVCCPLLFDDISDALAYTNKMADKTYQEMKEEYPDRMEIFSDYPGTTITIRDKKTKLSASWTVCICDIIDEDE